MASVHLVYGFTEGRWHGGRFRRQLRRRGYRIARSIAKADIVIAHSGGCFDVPPLRKSQTLVLINPTYWPDRSLTERTTNMTRQIIRSLRPGRYTAFNANKTAHNCYYAVRHYRKNRAMVRRAQTFDLEQEIAHHRTILVRNDEDPWLTPELQHLQALNPKLQIERLSGGHDDCWQFPGRYIDIVEAYRA